MKAWEKSEERTAKAYGKKVSASGALPFEKLDILGQGMFQGWRVENKHTEKASFSIKLETLEKMFKQASQMLSKAFLLLDFDGKRYVILREQDWIVLNERLYEAENSQ